MGAGPAGVLVHCGGPSGSLGAGGRGPRSGPLSRLRHYRRLLHPLRTSEPRQCGARSRPVCSLGYWLAREQTGRGVATTAVKQALRIAFDHLNPDQSGGWPNGGAPTRDVWEQWAHRRNELLLAVVAIRAYEAEIPTSVRKEEEGVYVGYRAAPSTSCTTDTNATASWWPPRRTPSAPPQAVWRAKCAGLTPGPATASRGSWTSTTSSR